MKFFFVKDKKIIRNKIFCNRKCANKNKNKGRILSEEHKKKISSGLKGENNPFYGKHLTQQHIEKRSKTGIERGSWKGNRNHMTGNGWKIEGINNPFYGKTHSEKSKIKMSKTRSELISLGKVNCAENMRGRKGWHYSEKNKTKFYYDSLLEKYRMKLLDLDKNIVKIII